MYFGPKIRAKARASLGAVPPMSVNTLQQFPLTVIYMTDKWIIVDNYTHIYNTSYCGNEQQIVNNNTNL